MAQTSEQVILDFHTYPPIGGDDWRYAFQTARVRALETQMLTRATLHDMAAAATFQQAADLLSATEYALPDGGKSFPEVERFLQDRRAAVRELFAALCIDEPIATLFRTRDDFANLRLALRRTLTERPVGADYSDQGNVPPEWFAQAIEEGNENLFGDYMQRAVDAATLAFYQNKDVRRIDYAIDAAQAEHNLSEARRLIQSGGVYVNNVRSADVTYTLTEKDLASANFTVLRTGKKNYCLLWFHD